MMDFIFGGNTGIATPEELARRRDLVRAIRARNTGAVPQNPWEGLNAIADAIGGRVEESRLNDAEAAGRRGADEKLESYRQGGLGSTSPTNPMATAPDRRKAYEIAPAAEIARPARTLSGGGGTGLRGPLGADGLPAHTNPTRPAGAPSRAGGTALSNAAALAALNRMDRELVERGTAFGKKHGIDTGFGIMFGDRRRFDRIEPDVILGKAPSKFTKAERESALLKLSKLQSLYGKPMGITDAMSPRGSASSQHVVGNAFDTRVAGGIPEKARVAELAAQLGFGGIGASYKKSRNMVHVDTRPLGPHGPRQWGPNLGFSSAPPWQRKAIARGFGKAPDWDAVIAANRSPIGLAEALAAMNSR